MWNSIVVFLVSWPLDNKKIKWSVIHFRKDVIHKYISSMTNNQIHLYLMNGWQQIPNVFQILIAIKPVLPKQVSAWSIESMCKWMPLWWGIFDASSVGAWDGVLWILAWNPLQFTLNHFQSTNEDVLLLLVKSDEKIQIVLRAEPNASIWWIWNRRKNFFFSADKNSCFEISKVLTIK